MRISRRFHPVEAARKGPAARKPHGAARLGAVPAGAERGKTARAAPRRWGCGPHGRSEAGRHSLTRGRVGSMQAKRSAATTSIPAMTKSGML